jgi:hypothetical protein
MICCKAKKDNPEESAIYVWANNFVKIFSAGYSEVNFDTCDMK